MELMMENKFTTSNEKAAYERAKKKVKEIKAFYTHLACYCTVMPVIIFINLWFSPAYHWFWFSLLGWGSGVLIHGLAVFGFLPFLGPDWEERKLNEILEKEKTERTKYE